MATPLNKKIGTTVKPGVQTLPVVKYTMVQLDKVKLWADNPRKNDGSVPKLMKLLQLHGQRSPLVVWNKNNVIYKGNTTWKALYNLRQQWKKLEPGQNEELFNQLQRGEVEVAFASFPSESAAKAYGISDNVSSEWSDWDNTTLSEMMRADTEGYFTKENTGLTEKDLAGLKMASEMPEQLESIDIEGTSQEKSDFLVLQFEDHDTFEAFKARMGLGKQERTLLYDDLASILTEE